MKNELRKMLRKSSLPSVVKLFPYYLLLKTFTYISYVNKQCVQKQQLEIYSREHSYTQLPQTLSTCTLPIR